MAFDIKYIAINPLPDQKHGKHDENIVRQEDNIATKS